MLACPQQPGLDENKPPSSWNLPPHDENSSASGYQHPRSFGLQEIPSNISKISSTNPIIKNHPESPNNSAMNDASVNDASVNDSPTPTTPTPSSEKLVERMERLDFQQQPTEEPHGQSQSTTTTTTTAAKRPSFCEPCQQARAAPDFAARVAAFFNLLHCARCNTDHAAIFFSKSQRSAPDSSRICIGHEGHCVVCPHLKFSFADVQRWRFEPADEDGLEIRCQEPSCPFRDAGIVHTDSGLRSQILIEWTASPNLNGTGTFWDRYVAKLQELHKSYPAAFCPHVQTSLLPISDTVCLPCHTGFHCDARAELPNKNPNRYHPPPISQFSQLVTHHDRPTPGRWIKFLDPDSYGHFADQDTKHITWCDDHGCTTTFRLFQSVSLQYLGAFDPNGMREYFHKYPSDGIKILARSTDDWVMMAFRQLGY